MKKLKGRQSKKNELSVLLHRRQHKYSSYNSILINWKNDITKQFIEITTISLS